MPPSECSDVGLHGLRDASARRWPNAVQAAWAIVVLAFVLFAFVAIRQHDTFHTRARDMGIYAQVIWNTSHGRPFASTLLEENRLHIAEHVAPVMALIVPLYALVPDPRLLLLLQQASLAGAGLPIFLWARRQVGELAALGLLVGYELMPMTSRIAFSEFHPIVMAALPVALGVRAVLEGRARAAVVWLVLALLFEEETAPIVGAAGAYLWLRHRQWSGFGLGALAAAWLLVLTLVVMPAFHDRRTLADVDGNRSLDHYEEVQERPGIALEWLAGPSGAHAATWLLLPTLGLPLLAPHVLWIAVPSFALLFLPDREGNVAGHWAGAVLPVYWFAAAAGLAVVGRLSGGARSRAWGRIARDWWGARSWRCWPSSWRSASGGTATSRAAASTTRTGWPGPSTRRTWGWPWRWYRPTSSWMRRAGWCRTWRTGRRCSSSRRRSTRRRCGQISEPSTCSYST